MTFTSFIEWLRNNLSVNKRKKLLIGIVISLILLLIVQTINSYYTIRKLESQNQQLLRTTTPLTVESIQGWMTFDYINFVFKLPPEYLRETLGIKNQKYPHIPLRRYADQNKIPLPTLIQIIQEAIINRQ